MRLHSLPKLLVSLLLLPQLSFADQYPGCKSGVYSSVGCALRNYPPAQTYCSKKVSVPKQTKTVTAPTSTISKTVSTTTITTTLSIATASVTSFSTTVTVSTSSTTIQITTSTNTVTQTSTSTATTTVSTITRDAPNMKRDAVAGRPTPNPQAARFSSLCKQPNKYITSVCKCVVKPRTTTVTTTPSTTKPVVATSTLSTTATVSSTFTATILTTTTIVVTDTSTQVTATTTLTTSTTTTSVTATETCPPERPTYCVNSNSCINTENNYNNCGACGNQCRGPGVICQGRSCNQAPNVCTGPVQACGPDADGNCLCFPATNGGGFCALAGADCGQRCAGPADCASQECIRGADSGCPYDSCIQPGEIPTCTNPNSKRAIFQSRGEEGGVRHRIKVPPPVDGSEKE